MKRKRIGANQREMLAKLEFLGPINLADLDQPGKRAAQSLVRQRLADWGTTQEVSEDPDAEWPAPEFIDS